MLCSQAPAATSSSVFAVDSQFSTQTISSATDHQLDNVDTITTTPAPATPLPYWRQWRIWLVCRLIVTSSLLILSLYSVFLDWSTTCDLRLLVYLVAVAIFSGLETINSTLILFALPYGTSWTWYNFRRHRISTCLFVVQVVIIVCLAAIVVSGVFFVRNVDPQCITQPTIAYDTSYTVTMVELAVYAFCALPVFILVNNFS